MRAGGMSHHENAPGVAAEFAHMIAGPAHGGGRVVEKAREDGLRINAVIRHDRYDASRGERLGDSARVRAITTLPASAVEIHDDGVVRASAGLGRIYVEPLARRLAIGDAARCVVLARPSRDHAGGACSQ